MGSQQIHETSQKLMSFLLLWDCFVSNTFSTLLVMDQVPLLWPQDSSIPAPYSVSTSEAVLHFSANTHDLRTIRDSLLYPILSRNHNP